MLLPVTLCTAAALAILSIWLMVRIGGLRNKAKIFVGDGGNDAIIRRMRAQANFVESAPFVFALILAVELAGRGGAWLPYVAGLYVVGRVAHAFGMEESGPGMARFAGTIISMLTLLGLAIVAVLITTGVM
ncbi:MAPEG family protein [Pontixanthobacter sp. CEM42]|uniref:MAPEG family protein n=1 Tax=Pontixanthobacter sp. CEM42 TaxID=2792077 RepID=UPI001AE06E0D|nr:MAPEG family protein [Pontixanthobacter sp. CEM42]